MCENISGENLSFTNLDYYENTYPHPQFKDFLYRIKPNTYSKFVDTLYQDIDNIVDNFQSNPQYYQKDSEDKLTHEICNYLRGYGYNALHGLTSGGQTDLIVKSYPPNNYQWIGEAKIHSSYEYLYQGFLQLTTRYSSGVEYQRNGGLLIYIRTSNAKSTMDKWQQELLKMMEIQSIEITIKSCSKNILAFISSHTHHSSGLPFEVRHIPIVLHYSPQDKSAMLNQKRKNKALTNDLN
jgi:hypothetical protein